MNSLPNELKDLVLSTYVEGCRGRKNDVLQMRLVCRYFDSFLQPYVFQTIQLECSKFHPPAVDNHAFKDDTILRVGKPCQALYCDMMVIRDNDEIDHLLTTFSSVIERVPEMRPSIESLRQFCMHADTFDENDYVRVMKSSERPQEQLHSCWRVLWNVSRSVTPITNLSKSWFSIMSAIPPCTKSATIMWISGSLIVSSLH